MYRKNNVFFKLLLLLFVANSIGCKEDLNGPHEKNGTAPAQVSDVKVERLPGKVTLTYKLPATEDLEYVKAVYSLRSGQLREVKSSIFNSSLLLEGFADTLDHEVKLYTVNRSETASEPLIISVRPKENPIWEVFRSLKVDAGFQGVNIVASNPTKENLAIMLLVDSLGKWVPYKSNIYTSNPSVNQTIRGFASVEKNFAVTIRDRWQNYTDTVFKTLTPLFETALSKSLYRAMALPGDAKQAFPQTNINKLWDNNYMSWPGFSITEEAQTTPTVITFDVGQLAKLSRIVINDYPEETNPRSYFMAGSMRYYEIWGSDNPPADGSWTNWVKLGEYENIKPSGSPYGTQTAEDVTTASAGWSREFRVDVPKLRYLRIKCNKNWMGTYFQLIAEVQVYGDPR